MIEKLMEAATEGRVEEIRTLLQKHPELQEAMLPSGESPLTAALYHGRLDAVETLLENGVAITVHEAAALGDVETIAYMLELEPSLLTAYSFDGWTPLHLACFFGRDEAVEFLLEKGADINSRSQNKQANMPIHTAVAGKRTTIVQKLLASGADPNVQQEGGWTPLQMAVNHFDLVVTELLLSHGADKTMTQDSGKTAYSIAEEQGYSEILEVLQRNE